MNRNTLKIIIFFATFLLFIFLLIFGISKIKVDEFNKASIMLIVDSSASNQKYLSEQKMIIKQLCSMLDPEDHIKILRVSQDAYIIYEGSPQSGSEIRKALDKFTQYDEKEYGTAYGQALKKAFNYSITMSKEGYIPAVVVVGDLENEGSKEKQINWNTISSDVSNLKKQVNNFSMMFLYASPQKLDLIKEVLNPVLGENNLIIGNEITTSKSMRRFLNALGR